LAALLRHVDDQCYYAYDLGDNWRHRLKVLAITNVEGGQSVELLDGRGSCPPEDSIGLAGMSVEHYRDLLKAYKANSNAPKVKQAIREIETKAMNYKPHCNQCGLNPFRPLEFNINRHRHMLDSILAGPPIEKTDMWSDSCVESMKCCAVCQDRLKPLMQCSICKKVKYCSKECQKEDWKKHKLVCGRQ
jgi:hypothetical protein